jgi:hypothetical protein
VSPVGRKWISSTGRGRRAGDISLHKDGRCHARFTTRPGAKEKIHNWTLPEPLPGSNVRRLADVVIPHRGLVRPAAHVAPDPDTVVLQPPEEGQQLMVSIFSEPGIVDQASWPGKTAMGTGYVGRVTLYTDEHGALMNFTAVTWYRPESDVAVRMSTARLSAAPGVELPKAVRMVMFECGEANGLGVPSLVEMPIGHLAGAPSS